MNQTTTARRKSALIPVLSILWLTPNWLIAGTDNLIPDGDFEKPSGGGWAWVAGGGNNTAFWFDVGAGFGFGRDFYGDFSGVTAHDGHEWVAALAYAAINDYGAWGQTLSATLQPGQQYVVSGWLHQAVRTDIDKSGGFDVLLNNTNSLTGAVTVAHLGDTTGDTTWMYFVSTFTAPADANDRPWVIFKVTGTYAYLGLDDVRIPNGSPQTPAVELPVATPSGGMQFLVTGFAGSNYVTQISSDLKTWSTIATNTMPATGYLPISDTGWTNRLRGYYRVAMRP